jgi:hypothetical protein
MSRDPSEDDSDLSENAIVAGFSAKMIEAKSVPL